MIYHLLYPHYLGCAAAAVPQNGELAACGGCSWFLVLGSWFLVPGSWFLVLGSWFLVLGSSFFVLRCEPLMLLGLRIHLGDLGGLA